MKRHELTYTLSVNVRNGSTNPDIVVDVDFSRDGLLLLGNRPLFIRADLESAGLPASVAATEVAAASAEVLSCALRIDDARVRFDAEKHPRLVAAMRGDLDALDRRRWTKRKRDKENAFLRERGYRWEKQHFYVGGEIGDIVSRWFLLDADGEAVVGSRPALGGIADFGNVERLLTTLGYHGEAAREALVEADRLRAVQRAAREVVDAANLTYRNDAGTFAPTLPAGVEMFHIDGTRDTYGMEPGQAIWVSWWDYWKEDLFLLRFPWEAQVAEALQTLRR